MINESQKEDVRIYRIYARKYNHINVITHKKITYFAEYQILPLFTT